MVLPLNIICDKLYICLWQKSISIKIVLMSDSNILNIPKEHTQILAKSKEIGCMMSSDLFVGTLLKTLISSKSNGRFLKLGTGIGLSLSWMIEGMDSLL